MSILYITEPDFLSDSLGIVSDKTETMKGPVPGKPEHLVMTWMKTPDIRTRKKEENLRSSALLNESYPVLFLLNDDTKDWEGQRFHKLLQTMADHHFFVFHIQISRQAESFVFAEFQAIVQSLTEQYPMIDRNNLFLGAFGRAVSSLLYITGHTNQYRAAFSLSGFVNKTTAYGNYENSHEEYEKSGTPDFKTWLYQETLSCPLRYLDQNNTPYLILHGHKDYICPEEQSEELFSGIKDRCSHVPCRMVILPEENHDILKEGHEKYTDYISEEIRNWFERFRKSSGD